MAKTTYDSPADLLAAVGDTYGPTDWIEITQERINTFADATDDHQWIHVDVEKAKAGPFGGPIAHGYLTLSLVIPLFGELLKIDGVRMGVNYGLEKVRFPHPVPVGSKIRLNAKVVSVEDVPGGTQSTFDFTVEIDGVAKPACVARTVYRQYV